jgi:hypothetical protein
MLERGVATADSIKASRAVAGPVSTPEQIAANAVGFAYSASSAYWECSTLCCFHGLGIARCRRGGAFANPLCDYHLISIGGIIHNCNN